MNCKLKVQLFFDVTILGESCELLQLTFSKYSLDPSGVGLI